MTAPRNTPVDASELRYVPPEYRPIALDNAILWRRGRAAGFAAALVDNAIAEIERLLDHRLRRTVHVVVYASNEDARRALDRQVAPTMLLAPLHTPSLALVALQAPAVDRRNADPRRMRRHLCHELGHVFSHEKTGSVKQLGDGDRGMRLASWVDEGFAQSIAALVAAQPEIIQAAVERASIATRSADQLAAAFGDLGSPDRSAAFAIATARVWRAVHAHGIRFVFEHLSRPEIWAS